MRAFLLCTSLVLALSPAALAQPTPAPVDQQGFAMPALPSPDLPPGSRPSDFLRAAAGALAIGNTGEAEQALEMAQTRMLDRSVPLGQTNDPSHDPTTVQITQARQALETHDRAGCMQLIQVAIASAAAQGM